MWILSQPWWEFIFRAIIVYGFIFSLLRFVGKKQIGQLTPFDFVLLLIISNAVQNSMNAGDNSVTAGLILAATLVAMNFLISMIAFKSKKAERIIDGMPVVLVHNGKTNENRLKSEQITHQDLMTAIHREGLSSLTQVHVAILEPNGQITVLSKK